MAYPDASVSNHIFLLLSEIANIGGLSASKVRWLELSQLSLCSEFDKENSMEFSLISLPTYTLYYHGYAPTLPWSSCYSSHVTHCDCDPWCDHMWPSVTPLWYCDKATWLFSALHLVVVSPIKKRKRKEKEKNINNDLGVFPSHDRDSSFCFWVCWRYLSLHLSTSIPSSLLILLGVWRL